VRVHIERRGGAGVAEALRDRGEGDSRGEHLARHEVAQIVQPEVRESGRTPSSDEALRRPIREPR
jgi:hypothetical protein